MAAIEQNFRLVQTGKSSWVAVHINHEDEGSAVDCRASSRAATRRPNGVPGSGELFAKSTAGRITFSERFPRLTIAVIAIALFAATLTAEIDFLHGAGYRWN
jgi:hypothetical protein